MTVARPKRSRPAKPRGKSRWQPHPFPPPRERRRVREGGPELCYANAVKHDQPTADEVLADFKEHLGRAVKPEDAATHYALAIAYEQMGLPAEAVAELELALAHLDHLPNDVPVRLHLFLGDARERRGDRPGALVAFRRALDADPSNEVAQQALRRIGEILLA